MNRPNIIFILMDDMGYRDLSFTGSSFYETPTIDKLCKEGVVFDNAYAACPVCSPSRASYLTGQAPARLGVTDWIDPTGKFHPLKGKLIDAPYLRHLPKDIKTIAHAFKENGYATWHVGKWHLGGEEYYPEKFGFEINKGGSHMGSPYYGYFSPYKMENLEDGPIGEYLTDRITNEAIKLIESDEKRPFYLSLCHYAVHTPIEAKQKDIEYFERKAKRLGLDKINPFQKGEEFHTVDKKGKHVIRRIIQSDPTYAAMIWNLDENMKKLIKSLKKSKKLDNTIIVFTSDNGGLATAEGSPTCNFPASEGKGWVYEGGTRIPLFIWYNGIKNNINSTKVITPDFYPTLLELAGLEKRPKEHKDGISFVKTLNGQEMEERPLYWHYPHYGNQGGTPGSSILFNGFKLIEYFEDNHLELYKINEDISESINVIEKYPEIVEKLYSMLVEWRKEVGAKLPLKNNCFE